ncbi:hypothetical protein A3Q56_05099, partial [Intoshia linei]
MSEEIDRNYNNTNDMSMSTPAQMVTIKQEVIPTDMSINRVPNDGNIIENDNNPITSQQQMTNVNNNSHVSLAPNNSNGGYMYA